MGHARSAIRQRLAAATYETLIGLLVVSGMRISEAIKLDDGDGDGDVDREQGVLLVRESKFNKSRYLPLDPTTRRALERYVRMRDKLRARREDPSVFISLRRRRLDDGAVHSTFRRLCDGPPAVRAQGHTWKRRTGDGHRLRARAHAAPPTEAGACRQPWPS